jgi:hypothetical protein
LNTSLAWFERQTKAETFACDKRVQIFRSPVTQTEGRKYGRPTDPEVPACLAGITNLGCVSKDAELAPDFALIFGH